MVPWVWAIAAAEEPAVVELTLQDALDRLAASGPEYAQAVARVDAARGIARQAQAAWLPIVVASGSYTRNDDEVVLAFSDLLDQLPVPVPGAPDDIVIQPLEVWNASGAVRVPLLAPSAWAESTAAHRSAHAAEASAAEIQLQLESGLVGAAASAEAAVGVLAAADRAVAVAEDHLASTRIAQAAGTATGVDVLSAQTDVSRRRSERLQARNALEKAQEGLGALLGIDGRARVTLPETPAPEAAMVERPALDAAADQVGSARARVQAAWWRHVPVVSAQATGLAATVPFPTGNDTAWRLGVEATWTLYDGGFRYGRLTQARAELASAEAFRAAEELRVSREVRDAQRDHDVAREQLSLAEEQAALGAEAASVARRGLAAGTVSPLQARDIEAEAFRADVGVATARARLRIAEATLRRARGLDQRW